MRCGFGGNTLDTDQSNDCILFRDERAHTNIKQEQQTNSNNNINKMKEEINQAITRLIVDRDKPKFF